MKIPRLDYDPASALAFFEESLSALGALCERTWHDRLEVLAEGHVARLWNEGEALHQQELLFAAADAKGARDAHHEVFPGCPLTFQIFEALRSTPLVLEKLLLSLDTRTHTRDPAVLEKLWRSQSPGTRRWRLAAEIKPAFHFSLVALARCEIQAIDQHWSLHRVAIALPSGEADPLLARELPLLEVAAEAENGLEWPRLEPVQWWGLLGKELEREMKPDVEAMSSRQQQYLQRELERLDDYFAHYEQELLQRSPRGASKVKATERLAAAHAERDRRRLDQVTRHEICVRPHLDALLLVAEPCWGASLEVEEQRGSQMISAIFVPRARRWFQELPNREAGSPSPRS